MEKLANIVTLLCLVTVTAVKIGKCKQIMVRNKIYSSFNVKVNVPNCGTWLFLDFNLFEALDLLAQN